MQPLASLMPAPAATLHGVVFDILVGSEHDGPITAALFEFVMPGHSRPKDGVASARLCPHIDQHRAG